MTLQLSDAVLLGSDQSGLQRHELELISRIPGRLVREVNLGDT